MKYKNKLNMVVSKDNQRETFASRWGFIIAVVGASMGMANIWMFPWRIGAHGGSAFLIPYLLFLFGFSIYGLMGEIAFGREMKRGTVGAFEKVLKAKRKKWGALLGIFPAIAVTGVFTFYVIVQGWILHYFYLALTGKLKIIDIDSHFGLFSGSADSILWHIISLIFVFVIIALGVQNGIEKACKIMMPIFYILIFVIMIRSITLPGAIEGVKFILIPRWGEMLNLKTWIIALGMSFFTLSLGSGNVVYGSYMRSNDNVAVTCWTVAFFDFIAAIMVAFAIIPAVFAFDLDPAAGPQLLFITLPKVLNGMPGGQIFSILFFLIVFFAALSSSIHMIEGPVEGLIHKLDWDRKKSTLLVTVVALIIGLALDLNMNLFTHFANLFSIFILPASAVLIGSIVPAPDPPEEA